MPPEISRASILFYSVLAGLIVTIIVATVLYNVLGHAAGPTRFGDVASLILVGFAAFIALMNVLSFGAFYLGITDRTQPFGLPEGTVRALLTLAFIVLVGVLASYLVTSSGGRTSFSSDYLPLQLDVTQAEAKAIASAYSRDDGIVSVVRAGHDNANPPNPTYNVVLHQRLDNRLSEDISKQILTMLSTILAAMIGFYFGARTDSGSSPKGSTDHAESEKGDALKTVKVLADKATKLFDATPSSETDRRTSIQAIIADLKTVQTEIEEANRQLGSSGLSAVEREAAEGARAAAIKKIEPISARLNKL